MMETIKYYRTKKNNLSLSQKNYYEYIQTLHGCCYRICRATKLREKKTSKKGGNIILNIFKPCMNAVVEEEIAGDEEDHEEDVPKSNCHHEDVAPLNEKKI